MTLSERDGYLKACDEPMGDYAPDPVTPAEGSDPKSAFVRRWRDRFRALLAAADA